MLPIVSAVVVSNRSSDDAEQSLSSGPALPCGLHAGENRSPKESPGGRRLDSAVVRRKVYRTTNWINQRVLKERGL